MTVLYRRLQVKLVLATFSIDNFESERIFSIISKGKDEKKSLDATESDDDFLNRFSILNQGTFRLISKHNKPCCNFVKTTHIKIHK